MAKKKKVESKAPELLGLDQIDFPQTFRIKGKQGLYIPLADAQNNGMIRCQKLTDKEVNCTARCIDLQILGKQLFTTYAGHDNLYIQDVFQNIINFKEKNPEVIIEEIEISELMAVMVPEYDEDLFRPSHCGLVLMWFNEIELKLKQLGKEKDVKKS